MDFLFDNVEQLIGFKLDDAYYYYIKNNQNDIIGILDSDGNQVVSYVYDSWGKLVSTTGSLAETVGVQNPYRYRGYYYDTESGFYYLNSRYYDPQTKRFLNVDKVFITTDDISSKNMYSYCINNPIINYDPSGNFVWAIGYTLEGNMVIGGSINITLLIDDRGNVGWQSVSYTHLDVYKRQSHGNDIKSSTNKNFNLFY